MGQFESVKIAKGKRNETIEKHTSGNIDRFGNDCCNYLQQRPSRRAKRCRTGPVFSQAYTSAARLAGCRDRHVYTFRHRNLVGQGKRR